MQFIHLASRLNIVFVLFGFDLFGLEIINHNNAINISHSSVSV